MEKHEIRQLAMPVSRIILRYGSGALVSIGLLQPDVAAAVGADPDLPVVVGMMIAVGTEVGYTIAKRRGGAT